MTLTREWSDTNEEFERLCGVVRHDLGFNLLLVPDTQGAIAPEGVAEGVELCKDPAKLKRFLAARESFLEIADVRQPAPIWMPTDRGSPASTYAEMYSESSSEDVVLRASLSLPIGQAYDRLQLVFADGQILKAFDEAGAANEDFILAAESCVIKAARWHSYSGPGYFTCTADIRSLFLSVLEATPFEWKVLEDFTLVCETGLRCEHLDEVMLDLAASPSNYTALMASLQRSSDASIPNQ